MVLSWLYIDIKQLIQQDVVLSLNFLFDLFLLKQLFALELQMGLRSGLFVVQCSFDFGQSPLMQFMLLKS